MTKIAVDIIAIDTNVFVHLFNPETNRDGHIDRILTELREKSCCLIIDQGDVIWNEYLLHVVGAMRASKSNKKRELLAYWLHPELPKRVPVSNEDSLMQKIKSIIVEKEEKVDRTFVYVALSRGRALISNDEEHIVIGVKQYEKQDRRKRLLNGTKKIRQQMCNDDKANILTSEEAVKLV